MKIAFWPLLINRLSDFTKMLYEEAERHVDKGYRTKNANFKIQDGGRTPFGKSLNRHISVEKLSDFDEVRYTTADVEPDCRHVTIN